MRRLAEADGGRVRLDALKVAHHGSAGNVSRDLLEIIDCQRYLFSTNGARYGHPDPVAVARILIHGGDEKELVFNYRQRTEEWNHPQLREKYGYTVTTAHPETEGSVTLCWNNTGHP